MSKTYNVVGQNLEIVDKDTLSLVTGVPKKIEKLKNKKTILEKKIAEDTAQIAAINKEILIYEDFV